MNSLRKLAKHLELSHATVSAALRGLPGVKPATRDRVLRAAEQHGYHINPLASALIGSMRRVETKTFRGVLVLLRPPISRDAQDPEARESGRIASGAAGRARELGFDLQDIEVGRDGNAREKLHDILLARGVLGLVMLATSGDREAWRRIDRGLIPCVSAGIRVPGLDFVGPDQEEVVALALRRLRVAGCERVGLALPRDGARERHQAWVAGFYAHRVMETVSAADAVPDLLIYDRSEEEGFCRWLEAGRYDAVISDPDLPHAWQHHLRDTLRNPRGVCYLNLHAPCERGPGVDLRWEEIGRKSVEQLADQILLRKTGRGASSTATTLCHPAWVGVSEAARLVA